MPVGETSVTRARNANTDKEIGMYTIPIETEMETFARTYAKDTGVNIIFGDKVCTDGSNIYLVPIPDQADEWLRFESEMHTYHETGHIKTKDVPPKPKGKTEGSVYNYVRDVCIEGFMESIYNGMKTKWTRFLNTYLKKYSQGEFKNPNTSPYRKLMLAFLYRCRGRQLGITFDIQMPQDMQDIYEDRLAQFEERVAQHKTIKESLQLTKEIMASLQMEDKEEEEQKKKDGGGKNKPQDGDDQNAGGGAGDPQDGDEQDAGNGDPQGSDDGDGDKSGSQTDGDGKPQPAKLSKGAQKALKKVQGEMEKGADEGGIFDDVAKKLNKYADTHKIYRVKAGLKEDFRVPGERSGWESEIAVFEEKGREITGYDGSKLKRLFISEQAPVTHRHLRTGKFDSRRIVALRNGSKNVHKRKTPSSFEDSAVALVVDHSGSMRGNSGTIAHSILAVTANDLDKLRVPFLACGMTSRENNESICDEGVRTRPCIINKMKDFDEPYRVVKHRFVWPSYTNITVELPAIQYATYQLAQRRETKKVLFIMADGGTNTGNMYLDDAMVRATHEFIARIQRAGVRVVPIGIGTDLLWNCDDAILVNDLNEFAGQFYGKLTQILL
jgi:cobalamin biosynthesis protein CobT